jgi:glycosyltransferase involved in cell wall biosynthesis
LSPSPKVSILLPSLNARKFLEPRIESLLNQTFAGWEAIVLDSHSNDGTWEFLQPVAQRDSRFQLHQIPREGLYAAINHGIDLATGEFIYVATADDTMAPQFLTRMLDAFSRCPEAAIAACDALFIDGDGHKLTPANPELKRRLSSRAIMELLELATVRTAFLGEEQNQINYRPAPHDSLIYFSGRSVYCSLTQLLIRTESARAIGPFRTEIGSVADFDWLLRATSRFGTVHLPQKLATWRFHGEQLSIYRDPGRGSVQTMCERILPEICQRHKLALTRNDRAALLLPIKMRLARSPITRAYYRFETALRLWWMILKRPAPTLRALRRSKFRFATRRHTLIPMIFQGLGLAPKDVETGEVEQVESRVVSTTQPLNNHTSASTISRTKS